MKFFSGDWFSEVNGLCSLLPWRRAGERAGSWNVFRKADGRRLGCIPSKPKGFRKRWDSVAAYVVLLFSIAMCSTKPDAAVEVKYALWDANQLPAYTQCAKAFETQNPAIKIKVSQQGWGDYWTALSTGIIAGGAPDVFTNHLAKYPELVKNYQLVDLAPLIARDKVNTAAYTPGLYDIWGRDGKQFGLPKDWDTIALVVNMAHAKKVGVTRDELWSMTWNPINGGSFERIVKRLTVDANGKSADDAQFAKSRVRVYGYQNPGPGGMMGQTEWSHFAGSTGWTLQAKPWEPQLNYGDARLTQTLDYIASLPSKGLSARYELTRSLGAGAMFNAGRAAIVPEGSWMVGYFAKTAKFEHAWVPLPKGPNGQRATILNGLADSIWAGSKVKDEAWAWVHFLGSEACQSLVAQHGVVFPAVNGLAEKSMDVLRSRGSDTSAFLEMARGRTFPPPIVDRSSEINDVVGNAIEAVLIGRASAREALGAADRKVKGLLKP